MRSIKIFLVLSSVCSANRVAHELEERMLEVEEDEVGEQLNASDPLQTKNRLPQAAGATLDWHFMTNTFSWEGRTQHSVDVIKDHVCNTPRRTDASYMASSMCYWHPELARAGPTTWGIGWRGGRGDTQFSCGRVSLGGVCARCEICHDNSRDRDRKVDSNDQHVVQIPLPAGCMKETAIRDACTADFETRNAGVLGEERRCQEVQGRFNQAVSAHDGLTANIHTLEVAVTQLTNNIAHAQLEVQRHANDTLAHDVELNTAERRSGRLCYGFGVRDHHRGQEILNRRPTCVAPPPPPPPPAPRPPPATGLMEVSEEDEEVEYGEVSEDESGVYERCQRCDAAMDGLRDAIHAVAHSQHMMQEEQQNMVGFNQEMVGHQQNLAQSYQTLPHMLHSRQAMEAEWHPQQEQCQQVYTTVANARHSHMAVCPRGFYDQSCEKACVEIQQTGEHGCGVVESSQSGDVLQRGGIDATCNPPVKSWIMDPHGTGRADRQEVCARINAAQSVRITTSIVMSGRLRREQRVGWRRRMGFVERFFVVESGNGVRSATVRSFEGDMADAAEEQDTHIILWDAESVTAGETSSDHACFVVRHHFEGRSDSWVRAGKDIKLCVHKDDYRRGTDIRQLRDQWVAALQPLLIWEPRVR